MKEIILESIHTKKMLLDQKYLDQIDEIANILVFALKNKKKISHIGVYLQNNKFVHASTKKGIIINDLDEPYYKKCFYKGGRVK